MILWDPSSDAMILFFVHYKCTFVMVLKDVQELPHDIPHRKRFLILESTQVLCLDDAVNLTCPTWWTIQVGNVICLLQQTHSAVRKKIFCLAVVRAISKFCLAVVRTFFLVQPLFCENLVAFSGLVCFRNERISKTRKSVNTLRWSK